MRHIFLSAELFPERVGRKQKERQLLCGATNKGSKPNSLLPTSHPQTREKEPHTIITFQQNAMTDIVGCQKLAPKAITAG